VPLGHDASSLVFVEIEFVVIVTCCLFSQKTT